MGTQETLTGLIEATEQGEGSDAVTSQLHGKDKRDYPADRATGGTKTGKAHHSSPEGETEGAERQNTYDNSSDGTNSTAIFETTSSRPKMLKTEGDDPTLQTRNRSKTTFKNPTPNPSPTPTPPPTNGQTYNAICIQHNNPEYKRDRKPNLNPHGGRFHKTA